MSFEPEFLELEDVLYIHEKQLETYGGLPGMRDQGLLESALAVPKSSFGASSFTRVSFKWWQPMLFTSRKTSPL